MYTPKGAEASAIVYIMVEMAKAHDMNIYKYLNHLLEHLSGTRMTDSDLSQLVHGIRRSSTSASVHVE